MRGGTEVEPVPSIGVRRRFPDRRRALRPPAGDWRRVVLNRHLVDWAALEATHPDDRAHVGHRADLRRQRADHRVRRVAPRGRDRRRRGHRLGQRLLARGRRSARPAGRRPGAGPARAENHGFALGNNLALAHATGDVVVFLNNDTTVPPGWLAPLRDALEDDDVLGAQPLLLYPSGTIQSAGIAFPTCGGLPHAFLQGFPVEDAYGVEGLRFHAVTGAALALRYADAVGAARLRPGLHQRHGGRRPLPPARRSSATATSGSSTAAPVVHHESRTPGRYDKHLANRTVYLDRWQRVVVPRDDAALWATRGLRVVDHDIGPARHGAPPRLRVPRPVLVREARLQVSRAPAAAVGDQERRPGRPGR